MEYYSKNRLVFTNNPLRPLKTPRQQPATSVAMMQGQQPAAVTAPPGFEPLAPIIMVRQQPSATQYEIRPPGLEKKASAILDIPTPPGFEHCRPPEKVSPQSSQSVKLLEGTKLSANAKRFDPKPNMYPSLIPYKYIPSEFDPKKYICIQSIGYPVTNQLTSYLPFGFHTSPISLMQQPIVIDLNVACSMNNIEMVKRLVNSETINMKDGDNWTPLTNATWKNSTEIIKLLLQCGADIRTKGSSGDAPLHHAVMHSNIEICKELINRGANVNEVDKHLNTPLHFATSKHNIEIMELLISKNADVNAKDKHGNTPLHRAAYKNDIRLSKILIDAGADIYAIGRDGETPLQMATKRGNTALQSLILSKTEEDNVAESIKVSNLLLKSQNLEKVWRMTGNGTEEELEELSQLIRLLTRKLRKLTKKAPNSAQKDDLTTYQEYSIWEFEMCSTLLAE